MLPRPAPRPGRGRLIALILATLVLAPVFVAPAGTAGLVPDTEVEGVHYAPWTAWRVENISDKVWPGVKRPITFDRDGNVYVGGSDDNARPAVFVREHGLWTTTRLNETHGTVGGLAFDEAGRPHVIYQTMYLFDAELWPYTTFVYAYFDGVKWVDTVLAEFPYASAKSFGVVFDSLGRVHVMYQTRENNLVHAWQDWSGWQRETVPIPHSLTVAEFKIDSRDRIHVMFNSFSAMNHYALRDESGAWSTRSIPVCYFDASIAVDLSDSPHFACDARIDGWQRGLAHVWLDAADAWQYEIVDDRGDELFARNAFWIGREPSITVDSRDRLHVSYQVLPFPLGTDLTDLTQPGRLNYAMKVNGAWVWERVDPDGYWNGGASLIVVDAMDRPHIVYAITARSTASCAHVANTCYDTRYASPVISELSPFGV